MTIRTLYISWLAVLLTLIASVSATAQDALFDKYEDTKGITTIFISKTMLGMIPDVKTGRHNIGSVAGKLDQLRILNCENKSTIPEVRDFAMKTYKKGKFEAIMKINEDGEKVTIYQRSLKDGKNEFSLFTESDGELTIINIIGKVTLKDIQGITGK